MTTSDFMYAPTVVTSTFRDGFRRLNLARQRLVVNAITELRINPDHRVSIVTGLPSITIIDIRARVSVAVRRRGNQIQILAVADSPANCVEACQKMMEPHFDDDYVNSQKLVAALLRKYSIHAWDYHPYPADDEQLDEIMELGASGNFFLHQLGHGDASAVISELKKNREQNISVPRRDPDHRTSSSTCWAQVRRTLTAT